MALKHVVEVLEITFVIVSLCSRNSGVSLTELLDRTSIVNSNDDPGTETHTLSPVPFKMNRKKIQLSDMVENTAHLFQNGKAKEPTQTINVWAMTYKYILSKNQKNLNKSFNK